MKHFKKNPQLFAALFAVIVCAIGFYANGCELNTFGIAGAGVAGVGVMGVVGQINNRGRIINILPGINGVSVGGTALVQLDVNKRYHRISFFVTEAGSAIAVGSVITSVKVLVNGVSVRDIIPADLLKIAFSNGYIPLLGELPIFFTEPFGPSNSLEPDDTLSWDMAGQSTFQIQLGITGTTPGVTGLMEFDYRRNLEPGPNGQQQPFLQPVAYHSFSQSIVTGVNNINTIPYNFPIRRMWFRGSSAGNLSALEIYNDGNKCFEGLTIQTKRMYTPYGIRFNNTPDGTPFVNATGPANLGVSALVETPAYFDLAFLADPDGRWWKALKVGQSLELRLTSGATQTLTTVVESMPGSYAS